MVLVAGHVLLRSRWDLSAVTESAGQPASSQELIRIVWSREAPTRSSSSIRMASGLMSRPLGTVP